MFEIHKDFTWDMGHRITKHGGKCYSPHGHTYRAVVWVQSEGLDEMGMTLDFYNLTQVCNPIIEDMDHAFMVNHHDTLLDWFFSGAAEATKSMDMRLAKKLTKPEVAESILPGGKHVVSYEFLPRELKTIVVPFESTAENIAKYIFDRVKEKIPNVCKVEVWETPKSCAVYTPIPGPELK